MVLPAEAVFAVVPFHLAVCAGGLRWWFRRSPDPSCCFRLGFYCVPPLPCFSGAVLAPNGSSTSPASKQIAVDTSDYNPTSHAWYTGDDGCLYHVPVSRMGGRGGGRGREGEGRRERGRGHKQGPQTRIALPSSLVDRVVGKTRGANHESVKKSRRAHNPFEMAKLQLSRRLPSAGGSVGRVGAASSGLRRCMGKGGSKPESDLRGGDASQQ